MGADKGRLTVGWEGKNEAGEATGAAREGIWEIVGGGEMIFPLAGSYEFLHVILLISSLCARVHRCYIVFCKVFSRVSISLVLC